jgi:hypothetical protein
VAARATMLAHQMTGSLPQSPIAARQILECETCHLKHHGDLVAVVAITRPRIIVWNSRRSAPLPFGKRRPWVSAN